MYLLAAVNAVMMNTMLTKEYLMRLACNMISRRSATKRLRNPKSAGSTGITIPKIRSQAGKS